MNITIIGGGITGLTTAIALHKLGIKCKVYEKAPKLAPVGAGIVMSPNAMKVFNWLGIDKEVAAGGIALKNAVITNKNLKPLRESKEDYLKDASSQFMVAIHRGALHELLVKHLPDGTLELDREFVSVEKTNDNVLQVHFKNHSVETNVLLGADGIHSRVRDQIYPGSHLRYAGYTCWRGVSRFTIPEHLKNFSCEAWGWNRRFGFVNIGEDMIYWFAVINAPHHFELGKRDIKAYLKGLFSSFHPSVNGMIDHAPTENIIRNDMEDLARLSIWHKGNVCLIGDAAHATTPNMGQGGAQGVEDAYYISQCLKKNSDPISAFVEFESRRRKKVDMIVNNSWMMGKLAHSSLGQPLLKFMLSTMSEKSITKQMQGVFHIEEPFAN